MISLKVSIKGVLAAGLLLAAQAAAEDIVRISTTEFNRVVFPEPYTDIIFPAGTPIRGQVLPVSNNRAVMFQIAENSSRPIQMSAQLESGRVITLSLTPDRTAPGAVYRVEGAQDTAVTESKSESSSGVYSPDTPNARLVTIFQSFTQGEAAPGFDAVSFEMVLRFNGFSAVAEGAWSDGTYRMLQYRLNADTGSRVIIAPHQFYRTGVKAVQVNGGDVLREGRDLVVFVLADESIWAVK